MSAPEAPSEVDPGDTCPFCLTEPLPVEARCPRCSAAYHADCWREGEGCVVNGCDVATTEADLSGAYQAPPANVGSPLPPDVPTRPAAKDAAIAAASEIGAKGRSALEGLSRWSAITARPRAGESWWRRGLVTALVVGLCTGTAYAAAHGYLDPIVGRTYRTADLEAAEATALREGESAGRTDGYSEGAEDGYDRGYEAGRKEGARTAFADGHEQGRAEGYDSGFDAGKAAGISEGCLAVFTQLGAFMVMDYSDHFSTYISPQTVSRSAC